jgi:hypothetical protein
MNVEHRSPLRRLLPHAAGLAALLAVLAIVVGTRSSFVTDEAFVVIQVEHLADTGDWALPHPFPEVDPTGAAFPLHGATRYEDGYTLYGKHALLVFVYLPVYNAFGLAGLVGLSVLGTVGAALGAGVLAERIRPGSGPLALWLTGVGSPLLFDAFVIHAHTLAAALAVLSVLLAIRWCERGEPVTAAGLVVALLATALLRTEGVFFAAAVGTVLGVMGLRRRRLGLIALGGASVGAGAAAVMLDRVWASALAGSPAVSQGRFVNPGVGFLEGRVASLSYTLVMPGYRDQNLPELMTALGVIVIIVGAVLLRRRPDDEGARLLPVVGAGLLVVRAVLEWGPIPGLILAFVAGIVGLVLLERSVLSTSAAQLSLWVVAVYAAAIALVQYPAGGHTEWGGRYFALGVPILAAVAAASLHHADATWPARRWRPLRASLVAATVALGVVAIVTLHASHDRNRQRSDQVLAAAAELPSGDGPPVVVTEDDQVPRLARERYEEVRFLRVSPVAMPGYLDGLGDAGVDDVLLVSVDPERSLAHLPKGWEPVGAVVPQELQWEGGGGLIRVHRTEGRAE